MRRMFIKTFATVGAVAIVVTSVHQILQSISTIAEVFTKEQIS